MNSMLRSQKVLRFSRNILLIISLISLIFASLIYWSRMNDMSKLALIAHNVTRHLVKNSEKIIYVNEWVYNNKGFAKNQRYFLLPFLGPSPIDVLEYGGDCADKSRLLSAMLKTLGIPSTLVMLFPCDSCEATHTVVEAKYENGWMVVDPVYNLYFPGLKGRFMGVKELSKDPAILKSRIRELQRIRKMPDKINYYDYNEDHYLYAKTINWDKNSLTRLLFQIIRIFINDPYRMLRPNILEDPKLFLSTSFLVVSFFAAAIGFLLTRYISR